MSTAAPHILQRLTTPARRTFSLLTHSRQLLKSFEPHPMARNATTQKAQPGDIKKLLKHAFAPLVVYVTSYVLREGG